MRELERPHVGLVRGIGPVALVFHLEGVAQHGAGHLQAGRDLVGQGADVHDRLLGVDHFREAGLDHRAVHLGHHHWMTADPLHPVQNHEAGTVGEEVGRRRSDPLEAQGAVGAAGDACPIVESLFVAAAARSVGDGESISRLFDLQVAEVGIEGAPELVAHDVGDGANRLAPVVADVAEVAGVELRRQRTRGQQSGSGGRLVGAEPHDCAGWGFGHGQSP